MDQFARQELDCMLTRTCWARYIFMLTHVLWPGGVWDEEEPRRNEAAKAVRPFSPSFRVSLSLSPSLFSSLVLSLSSQMHRH